MPKKSQLKPWQRRQWCIGKVDGNYLAAMEEVLDVYGQEAQEGVVRLCFDERPCQLLDHILTPLPLRPGRSERIDSEYERKGTCCVLLAYDMDRGERYAQVRERRTKADYAQFLDRVVEEHYPQARRVELVQDNLNTHTYGSFYEHLPVERAAQLRKLIGFHFTPKHGSWLNMAEIEFSALSRQCLDRRIATMEQMQEEVKAWVEKRNELAIKINWSFTTSQARDKMKTKYKTINPKI